MYIQFSVESKFIYEALCLLSEIWKCRGRLIHHLCSWEIHGLNHTLENMQPILLPGSGLLSSGLLQVCVSIIPLMCPQPSTSLPESAIREVIEYLFCSHYCHHSNLSSSCTTNLAALSSKPD